MNSLQLSYITIDGTFTFITPLFVILMSTLGGRNHWLGPVLGAGMIVLLQERLAGSGFASFSQILLGAVLALTILFVPEGLYLALRRRWRAVVILFVVVMAVQVASGLFSPVLTQLLVALIICLPLLIVPARFLRWAPWLETAPRHEAAPGSPQGARPDAEAVNLGH